MAMGRPTKYQEWMAEKAEEYLEVHTEECEEVVPTVAGLSLFLGVSRQNIYDWASEKNPDFLYTVEKIRAHQEVKLTSGGLSGGYNPQMAKFLLGAHHGLSEKSEVKTDHTSSDGSMTPQAYTPEQYAKAQADMKDKGLD